MSERNGLKDCPFCGSDEIEPRGWHGEHGLQCNLCGATAVSDEAWNRRAGDPTVTDVMLDRAMKAPIPGGSQAWVWLFNCEGGMQPEEKHKDFFRRVLISALSVKAEPTDSVRVLLEAPLSFSEMREAVEANLPLPAAGLAVESWHDQLQREFPNSEPEHWPDSLTIPAMGREIRELRTALSAQQSAPERVSVPAAMRPGKHWKTSAPFSPAICREKNHD